MQKKGKLLAKAKNKPKGLSFKDFQTLLNHCGWIKDHQTGSHEIWYSKTRYRLSIQNRKGKAKEYQVKQFLDQYYNEVRKYE